MPPRSTPFAKKSLGQNFLIDANFIRKIVDAVAPSEEDAIVEIGPGEGALTEKLVDHAGQVIAIELDRDFIAPLEKQFSGNNNFRLVPADALEVDFAELQQVAGKKLKLVANLPYYISTAILQRLIESRHSFLQMVLMFQREVVDRITAKPDSSDRGYLTVLVEKFLSIERLFDVPPTAFRPRPKIWSSVVRLTPKRDDPAITEREAAFQALVSAAFRQKRKTILNNLKSASLGVTKGKDLARQLSDCGIDPSRRAETLTIEEWTSLLLALNQ